MLFKLYTMSDYPLLSYEVHGHGEKTMVLLHGFLENKKMWRDIIPVFSDFTVLNIDLYGHGNSPDPSKKEWSMADFSAGILEILKKERTDRFSIIGHSLGGYVASNLAENNFKRIEKFILLNAHPWGDSTQKKKERTQVAKWVEKRKSLFINQAIPHLFISHQKYTDEVKELIDDAEKMSKEAIIKTTYAMRDREDKSKIVAKFKNRALVIQGELDPLINAKKMEIFCLNHELNFCLLKGVGHMGHLEDKKAVKKRLVDFIQF